MRNEAVFDVLTSKPELQITRFAMRTHLVTLLVEIMLCFFMIKVSEL